MADLKDQVRRGELPPEQMKELATKFWDGVRTASALREKLKKTAEELRLAEGQAEACMQCLFALLAFMARDRHAYGCPHKPKLKYLFHDVRGTWDWSTDTGDLKMKPHFRYLWRSNA